MYYDFPIYHFASDRVLDLDEIKPLLDDIGRTIRLPDSMRFIPKPEVYGENDTPTIYFYEGDDIVEVITKGCDLGLVQVFFEGLGSILNCKFDLLEAPVKPEKPTFDFGV